MGDFIPYEPQRLFQVKKPLGMEGFTARELGIDVPRLQLIHNPGPNDIGRQGQYKLTGGQVFSEVPIVVVRGHHYRTLTEGEGRQTRTVCASADGAVPHTGVQQPRSESCPHCPYGQWKDGVGGKRVPPPCADGIALLLLVLVPAPESSVPVQPAWFLCRKTALNKAQALGKAYTDRGVQTIADYELILTSEYKKPQGVGWWEPVFTFGQKVDMYRPIAEYVDRMDIRYVAPVFGTTVAAEPAPGEPDPWDVPV